MYHRIAVAESDVWQIAVSPENFEQHLRVLQAFGSVLSVGQLLTHQTLRTLPDNSIALTFDDGFEDNYSIARPLLEKYSIPATFFITTQALGTPQQEYWWDELERIVLLSPALPQHLALDAGGIACRFDLRDEGHLTEGAAAAHRAWDPLREAPPTLRAALYLELYHALRPLPYGAQQAGLAALCKRAAVARAPRPAYQVMSAAQVAALAQHPLITLGAHTVTHPALAMHGLPFQRQELAESRDFLAELTGQAPDFLAYPYGSHNEETLLAAREASYTAAFTTYPVAVSHRSDRFALGRFQVNNWDGEEFHKRLRAWLRYN
ncbi:MAG TPA: polysaccharide deacetylase family protein [Hymenobacter sp.]|jgi:peptidoglycan/xylan/chitin deacetylase (PgdA/CDA1 family)|uniref:polysaccharide deacetylase family protein n=1 Tax=Hymenobacter sp. TaxID=1898978 RepID=UPI002ED9C85D